MTTKQTRRLRLAALAATILVAASCSSSGSDADDIASPASSDAPSDVGIANPAAVFCEEQGGSTFGPEPMCGLPDGSAVDAWEYFRSASSGETAPPAATDVDPQPEETVASTTAATTTTTVVEADPIDAEPFQRSYPTIAELPELPTAVSGYVAVGDPQRTLVRVFESADEEATVYEWPVQANRCNYGFWVARWTSGSPDVELYATNAINPFLAPNELEPWLLPPAAPAGMLASNSCEMPGFWMASDNNEQQTTLIDAAVEWQFFELDRFEEAGDPPPAAQAGCAEYVYNDSLPISVCSQGFSVELFQEALGLNADGYFGPGTETAVKDFQTQVGLPATGVIDASTWSALGATSGAPFPDLNGDGVIDGSEFPFT